jgi:hypothetical protein
MTNVTEFAIENRSVRELEQLGCLCIKTGSNGWPDRMIVYAPGRVIWIEFKTPTGKLRPAQKVRIKQLEAKGHAVTIARSHQEALAAVASARRSLVRSKPSS